MQVGVSEGISLFCSAPIGMTKGRIYMTLPLENLFSIRESWVPVGACPRFYRGRE